MAPQFGMEGMEARFARTNLELDGSGISLFRIAPDHRAPFGHHHESQEEIYLLIDGGATFNVEGEEIELAPMDALRVAPTATRGMQAGPDGRAARRLRLAHRRRGRDEAGVVGLAPRPPRR